MPEKKGGFPITHSHEHRHDFARAPDQEQQQTAGCTNNNNNNNPTRGGGAVIDPYDDATLGRLAPEAYGRDGCFDPITAHLLVRGHFVPAPAAAAALAVRVQAELEAYDAATDRRRHHGSRPKKRMPSKKNKENNTSTPSKRAHQVAPTNKRPDDPGDRAPWDDEMTRVVVELHAKRVSFKRISVGDQISHPPLLSFSFLYAQYLQKVLTSTNVLKQEHIAGKGVKACQEHYYRAIKAPAWKKLHKEIRQKHALG